MDRGIAIVSGRLAAVVVGALAVTSCTLEIDAPSRVRASQLDSPGNAALLANSVQADFECALAHYIVTTGLLGNELRIAAPTLVVKEIDKRDVKASNSLYTLITCSSAVETTPGLYKPLSTARWQADNTVRLLEGWSDAEVTSRQALIATASGYGGYSLILLGESMCTAAIDIGPELTPAQLFEEAELRFSKGIAAAQVAASADLVAWNRLGRARARLRLGKTAAALADAQEVPASFVKNATYSGDSPRRENLIWVHGQRSRLFTVDPSFRGLDFGGTPDPRVPVTFANAVGSDGSTPLWTTSKYPTNASPIPFATGIEARLIVAEVVGGQTAVDIINQLHATAGLPPFSATDPTVIRAQVIEERKRSFFLDGHHLGDLRQYNFPLTPAPGSPFVDLGGFYGDQQCFPLPDVERVNNPNIND